MPVHDWTRVDHGTFHDFHTRWIAHLTEALNGGLLPAGYYAMAETALWHGIHLVLVDLIPPGPYDPQGMHAALWERFDDEPYLLPANEPLTLASYVAGPRPEAYLEHLAIGLPLAEMPLFLNPDRYVNLPLETTYLAAYRGTSAFWRDVLEGDPPSMP
jgi:hypothetical protein